MAICRLWNPDHVGCEPRMDLTPSLGDRLGTLKDSWIRDNAQETEKAGPRKRNRPIAAQLGVQPTVRPHMLRKRFDARIDKQVGIEKNHSKDALSATANTSATLSMLPSRRRPRSTEHV